MALPVLSNPLRSLARLDPFGEIDDMFRNFGVRPLARQYESALEMRMDLREDDKAYRATIDVPGVRKDDIDVSIDGSRVTVKAEVNREQSRDNEKELYSERYNGQAYRSFTLPQEVDAVTAEAHYDSGVLSLVLPKKADGRGRRLSIN